MIKISSTLLLVAAATAWWSLASAGVPQFNKPKWLVDLEQNVDKGIKQGLNDLAKSPLGQVLQNIPNIDGANRQNKQAEPTSGADVDADQQWRQEQATALVNLNELFDGKVRRLNSIKQVSRIASNYGLMNAAATNTDEEIVKNRKRALRQVNEVMMQVGAGQPCLAQVGDDFATLHREQLAADKKPHYLPEQLILFMRALGFELAAECKRRVIEATAWLDKSLASVDGALSPIKELENAGAVLLDERVELAKTDILRVAGEILTMIRDSNRNQGPKLVFSNIGIVALGEMRLACDHVYEPIYRDLFDTVMELDSLGYYYPTNGPLLSSTDLRKELNSSKSVRRWLNIMLTCEAVQHSPVFALGSQNQLQPGDLYKQSQLPDELLIAPIESLLDSIPLNTNADSTEARQWRDKLYRKSIGDNYSFVDQIKKDEQKFWRSYLMFIDNKMVTSHTS